jgi:hypothetical protein
MVRVRLPGQIAGKSAIIGDRHQQLHRGRALYQRWSVVRNLIAADVGDLIRSVEASRPH